MLAELGTFGIRARPFNIPLTHQVIVIGLGQVGLKALAKTNEMLDVALPPRVRHEQTRLLAIAQHHSIRQEHSLPRESRLLLTTDSFQWSDIPGHYAALGVAKWWPHTPNNRAVQEKPHLTRSFGRLLLWSNAELVSDKLYELSDWLVASSERERLPRQILVLASLTESESSGMIYDVVGRLRALLLDMPTEIIGVLTCDADFDSSEDRIRAMANCYATLKELDATSLQPDAYAHDLPILGRQREIRTHHSERNFDHICVTGSTETSIAEPEGALAEFAVSWVLNLLNGSNQPPLLPELPDTTDAKDRFIAYSTFGVAKITLPVRAALDLHMITAAKTVLNSLLMPQAEPVHNWVNLVMTRAHKDLYSQGLLDHHLLVDRMRELRRRITPSSLKNRVQGGIRNLQGWKDLVAQEWQLLLRENEPEELDRSGVPTPRDVLRRRLNDALDESLRPLEADLEMVANNLAFREGRGLHWTYQAYCELGKAITDMLQKMGEKIHQAKRDVDLIRREWLTAADERNPDTLSEIGVQAINTIVQWLAWQARLSAWEQLYKTVDDIVARLDYSIKQIPAEIENLDIVGDQLATELEKAAHVRPQFPAGVVCSEGWVLEGTRNIPQVDNLHPSELIANVYKRWNPGHSPPALQLQTFPKEVLSATRLTFQADANFRTIHDFLLQPEKIQVLRQTVAELGMAAAPQWMIKAVTDRLDDLPTLAASEIVREIPRPFSMMPVTENSRIRRIAVPSPDPDELVDIRITHSWSAEHIQRIRNDYRRAYYRVAADHVPLHIDRRWETTMADLVHTTLRSEISNLWDQTVRDNQQGGKFAYESLWRLSDAMAMALDVEQTNVQRIPTGVSDIHLHLYNLQPFRLKIPPPVCSFIYLLSNRSAPEISDDLTRILTNNMPEEHFFFVVNITGRPDMDKILAPLYPQGFKPLELTEADFKHITSAPKPTNALRDIVINRINLTAISPFYTRAPVPDHMFFGREKEIADVRSKLSTHSVVLIGGRRIGKTSTLQKIYRTLEHEDSPVVPYYLDCSNMQKHSHFFRRIKREWNVDITDMNDPIQFDEVVEQLLDHHPDKIPVFLMDEVDRLLKTDQADNFDEPLFRTFRTLSNENRCQFVFSGEKLLMRSINNAHSVLFNFPKHVKLSPLREDVVRHLVTDPFEMLNIWLENVDELISQIYQVSAGHPNIVQTICHSLVEIIDQDKQTNLLTQKHLGRTLDIHEVQHDIVETIWGQMHPLAKLITMIWPENVRSLTMEQIIMLMQRVGVSGIKTQIVKEEVIPDLILYNFIRQQGQQFWLIPIHFPTILDEMTNKQMEIRAILDSLN